MSAKHLSAALFAAAVFAVSPVFAQQKVDADQLLMAAYSLRRRGKFAAAGAAFEQVLERMAKSKAKEELAQEAAQLFRVSGRLDKALWLYRRNHDYVREIDVLFEMGRNEDALTVARLEKYPKGEALALATLGKVDEGLKLLTGRGLAVARGELLTELGRFQDAATAFEQAEMYYEQAHALSQAGLDARRAYEDALIQLRPHMKEVTLEDVKKSSAFYSKAPDGITRERARLKLAQAYGALAEDYRRLAEVYVGAREPVHKAIKLAENAITFLKRQRATLEDAKEGGDAFGKEAAKNLKIAEKLREVEAEIQKYKGLPH